MVNNTTHTFDVIIVGAGPAGTACALALKNSGLRVAMLDKAKFPRDKVCGDAIPGRAVRVLRDISPQLMQEFHDFKAKCFTARTEFFVNTHKSIEVKWISEAYTCARLDFDNRLFEMVGEHTDTTIFEEIKPTDVIRHENGIEVICAKQKMTFRAPIVIGCDGAHSIVQKKLTDFKVDLQHYGGAVRAYYENVQDLEMDKTEVYATTQYLPGYFWVFPLPENRANVGFGMLSKHISQKRLNLKSIFFDFIETHPVLRRKFADSNLLGKVQGFGLPFGSQKVQVSGDRFLLTGDAASLIDPASGDGIGNAMWSAKLAAEQTIACFEANRFDAAFVQTYEQQLYAKLWSELRRRAWAQRIATQWPWLLDVGIVACQNRLVKRLLHRMM